MPLEALTYLIRSAVAAAARPSLRPASRSGSLKLIGRRATGARGLVRGWSREYVRLARRRLRSPRQL